MKCRGSIIKPQSKGQWQLKHTILLFHLHYACQAFRSPFLLLYSLSLAPFFKLTTYVTMVAFQWIWLTKLYSSKFWMTQITVECVGRFNQEVGE